MTRAQAAVIGAGPAGLMAAEVLAHGGAAVTVYDRMPSAGRKFLLAGRGGLNLTHSEPLERFLGRYGAAEARLRPAMEALPPEALRAWSEGLGQSTFVGSSGRVFPAAFKASPLLRAWLRRLETLGVIFRLRHRWTGWDGEGRLLFESPAGEIAADAGATVLALGGASWPRLGSDGSFADVLLRAGVAVAPLQPANCGFIAGWSDAFRDRFEGQPLKRIALSFGARTQRGEAIVTRDGLEGGAVYALSGPIRDAILAVGEAHVSVDLRPDMTAEKLCERLGKTRGKQSFSNHLRKTIGLTPAAIAFLQEARSSAPVLPSAMAPATLAAFVKSVPVRLIGIAPAARAISTAGGVRFDAVDGQFMLRERPGTFVAGEMLDWEAPTGGYLLQACFATGATAAHGALGWLHRDGRADGIPPAST